ncbi:peptidylprolyl isomerase [Maribacter polysiphoniae]|uniref:Periplasmic chaperone PpiD n=1 Tax=Maribacter polysiphoniae TaxID=429344 RepID=A0A316E6E3_9FLAO|nr:SurA N-terminal domain-containing protein [Maribacter polysiphoniae]MBD1262285.1 peptidylprolyl isomerase [Maribacter polysiphoniae]PWK25984.1 peptidyl-prolyl cis-trans isomerase D [Maribacter polysiphoniae]
MAILENIRKRTTVLILIIGLALFAFVISGVFTKNNMSGGKIGSSVAEVNGDEISIDDFRRKVEVASNRYGSSGSSMMVVNQVYDQEVRNAILGQQYEDLGIDIEKDQIMNYIKTIPAYNQNPQFMDENGIFDENKFLDFIAELKANSPSQYNLWLQDEQSIIQNAKQQTYFNLVKAGLGVTLKEGELDYKLANDKVDIKYVRVPYTSIADSTIAISKSEIQSYIKEHKEEFKQEDARDIQYVYFEEKASVEDVEAVRQETIKLLDDTVEYRKDTDRMDTIPGFRNTKDIEDFLDRKSDIKYDTIYRAKKDLPTNVADTLVALEVGEIFGPYRDGDYFKVSKMIDKKINGSAKASHILISWKGSQSAGENITRTKEEAEAKAKELLAEARKKDAVFVQLARDNSDGPSAPKGGDLGYFQEGAMVTTFNDFVFSNKVGTIGLVETDFGFHVIKIDDKQDVYRIATLAREIEPSESTINNLFQDATKFEMDAIAGDKSYADLAKENDYQVRPVNKIKVMDESLPGLGSQRSIVQWAFKEDTEVGDIKRFSVNNGYVIAQMTAQYEEGLKSVEDASVTVLPILRKERKAEQIIAANKGKSMEEVAKDNSLSVSNASALTVKAPTIPGAGREPAVVGTAFAMKVGDTSDFIKGETGVYLISVTNKQDAPKLDNYSTFANAVKNSNAARVNTAVYNALKNVSDIEDNRSIFY